MQEGKARLWGLARGLMRGLTTPRPWEFRVLGMEWVLWNGKSVRDIILQFLKTHIRS
jgi:hypothetical protein